MREQEPILRQYMKDNRIILNLAGTAGKWIERVKETRPMDCIQWPFLKAIFELVEYTHIEEFGKTKIEMVPGNIALCDFNTAFNWSSLGDKWERRIPDLYYSILSIFGEINIGELEETLGLSGTRARLGQYYLI